jgi:uncharacterized membrane protein YcfT
MVEKLVLRMADLMVVLLDLLVLKKAVMSVTWMVVLLAVTMVGLKVELLVEKMVSH